MTLNTSITIKSLRCKKFITQQEMADKLGIARQTYNGYETDILKCNLETVLKILDALECTKAELKEFLFALQQDALSHFEKK